MKPQLDEVLLQCLEIPGQSGFEEPIRSFLKSKLANYGDISFDRLGSLICKIKGTDETEFKWMVSAHMDVNGFIVHSFTGDGLIKCVNFGYRIIEACHLQPVIITTSTGSVMGTLYAKGGDKGTPLFSIDVGTKTPKEIQALNIKPGDPIHFANKPYLIGDQTNQIICSPRLDNRMGIYQLILLAEKLLKNPSPADVFLVASVEEEVGARGAKTAAALIEPDMAIVLDVTYDEFPVFLGQGPVITLSDKSVLLPTSVRDYLLNLAKKHKIPVQTEVWNIAGTDARSIRVSGIGVPSIPILTATKNNHTPAEIGSIKDCYDVVEYCHILINNYSRLLELFIM